MTYESIEQVDGKIYRDGLVVLYKRHHGNDRETLRKAAQVERTYKIRKSEIVSASINLFSRKKWLIWFITYTFAFDIDEKAASVIWSNHLKNLKLNYKVNNYVWVKEAQKNGRIHFHVLFDSPRLNIVHLQQSFNRTITNYDSNFRISNNSVRLGNNPRVFNITQCAKYIAKYCSKGGKKERRLTWNKKCYSYTANINDVCRKIDGVDFAILAEKYQPICIHNDQFFELWVLKGYMEYEQNGEIHEIPP